MPNRLAGTDVLSAWSSVLWVVTHPDDEPFGLGAGFAGHDPTEVELVPSVVRAHQWEAVSFHPSPAVPGSLLWRRPTLFGDVEHLRWLHLSGVAVRLARTRPVLTTIPLGV